jgi:hypothetical protein
MKNHQQPRPKAKKRKVRDAMMDKKMKNIFTPFTENTQKQLTEQTDKKEIEIVKMKMKQTTI